MILYILIDSKNFCYGKEINIRFEFVTRKAVQTNARHSEHFLE